MLEEVKKKINKYKKGKLASLFYMGDLKKIEWQIDFFEGKKIYSLMPNNEMKEDNIFGEEKPNELEIEKVKIDFSKAMKIMERVRDKKYKEIEFEKVIAILQKNEKIVWNITWLTRDFKVFNVRIDATNGVVVRENCESILSFRSK